jgi:ribosome biogenesis GTPase
VTNRISLTSLGWQPFFQQQLSLVEWELFAPARVVEQHKSAIEVLSEAGKQVLPTTQAMPSLAVGDWILLDSDGLFSRALDRKSCFRRKAAGSNVAEQLIAANVDTAFIVCSLNDDFNLNRIERYSQCSCGAGYCIEQSGYLFRPRGVDQKRAKTGAFIVRRNREQPFTK